MIYRNVEIGWCVTNQEFYGVAFGQSYDRSIQQSIPTPNVRQRCAPLQRAVRPPRRGRPTRSLMLQGKPFG